MFIFFYKFDSHHCEIVLPLRSQKRNGKASDKYGKMETRRVSAVRNSSERGREREERVKRKCDRENGGERAVKTKLWLFARFSYFHP